MKKPASIVFGPVPSRRLGRSLGINNILPKTCSYSCVYCQVGKTNNLTSERQVFYNPKEVVKEVRQKVNEARARNEKIDYLTFVSEGEPTLDLNLSKEICSLRKTGIPIAVITNASLLFQEDVREDLQKTDFVSLKLDAISTDSWQKINRPHKKLTLNAVLDGICKFTESFQGTVVSETMLIGNIDYQKELEKIAEFLAGLKKLKKAYIAIPTRPPTEKCTKAPDEDLRISAFQAFSKKLSANKVQYLTGYEGDSFSFSGNVEVDLLSITAVHPMREEAVRKFLAKSKGDWKLVETLLAENKLVKIEYEGNTYYNRKLAKN